MHRFSGLLLRVRSVLMKQRVKIYCDHTMAGTDAPLILDIGIAVSTLINNHVFESCDAVTEERSGKARSQCIHLNVCQFAFCQAR